MNRRNILAAIASLPILLSNKAYANIPISSNRVCKNKIGLDCHYTKEFAKDLLDVHALDIERLFSQMYGTTFTIDKMKFNTNLGKTYLRFDLRSNDDRDFSRIWTIEV